MMYSQWVKWHILLGDSMFMIQRGVIVQCRFDMKFTPCDNKFSIVCDACDKYVSCMFVMFSIWNLKLRENRKIPFPSILLPLGQASLSSIARFFCLFPILYACVAILYALVAIYLKWNLNLEPLAMPPLPSYRLLARPPCLVPTWGEWSRLSGGTYPPPRWLLWSSLSW